MAKEGLLGEGGLGNGPLGSHLVQDREQVVGILERIGLQEVFLLFWKRVYELQLSYGPLFTGGVGRLLEAVGLSACSGRYWLGEAAVVELLGANGGHRGIHLGWLVQVEAGERVLELVLRSIHSEWLAKQET